MMPFEIYFKSSKDLDAFAAWLKALLNIPDRNITPSRLEQDRDGINYGGAYYLFEILGLELFLLENQGEVEIPERSGYRFYMIVRSGDPVVDETLAGHICEVVRRAGIPSEVGSLSA